MTKKEINAGSWPLQATHVKSGSGGRQMLPGG